MASLNLPLVWEGRPEGGLSVATGDVFLQSFSRVLAILASFDGLGDET